MNCKQIIEKVASIAENAEIIGEPMTAEYVSQMSEWSQRFAGFAIQHWEAAGSPIGE